MKWLLVTTASRNEGSLDTNIGDEFARIGAQHLISTVDMGADFDVLDKEDEEAWETPREFDRAVICGMPLFWSTTEQTEQDIWWWERMWRQWLAADPRKLMALGVGHVLMSDPIDPDRYVEGMEEATRNSWRIVTREPIAMRLPSFVESICPSAWCLAGHVAERRKPLCSMMPGGGHFGHLTEEGQRWDTDIAKPLSSLLFEQGFEFVAHTQREADYATEVGWPSGHIHLFNSAVAYLDLYADASYYIGNRIHGALVCASTRCPVLALTHDSRLTGVQRLGGHAAHIDQDTLELVKAWLAAPQDSIPPDALFEPARQFDEMHKLVTEFMLPL